MARGADWNPGASSWGELLGKEAKLPRRERRSAQRLFEERRGSGYDGAHDGVHRFVKAWRNERARVPVQAFAPMSFAPGEAYQFAWSHETITLQMDKSGFDPTLNVRLRHSFNGGRYRRGGLAAAG